MQPAELTGRRGKARVNYSVDSGDDDVPIAEKYKASATMPKRKLKRVFDDDSSEDEVRLQSLGYYTSTPFPRHFAGLPSPRIFLARWSIQHPFEFGWRVCQCV